uniref:ZM domain-containing protein n=1 Tax=Caenorhabditis tropicalis TaxID=1561998 RepID=A0A1I7U135_9PELO
MNTFDQSDEDMLYGPPSHQTGVFNSQPQSQSFVQQHPMTSSSSAKFEHMYNHRLPMREPLFETHQEPAQDFMHARDYTEFVNAHVQNQPYFSNHAANNAHLSQQNRAPKRKMDEPANGNHVPVKKCNNN